MTSHLCTITVLLLYLAEIALAMKTDSKDTGSEGPAAKCQDIYQRDKNSLSGYYDITIGNQVFTVYCFFHHPRQTVIRQLYDIDGNVEEWNIDEPVGVSNGDPEGAMEMQVEPHEMPPGAGPHFTQPIIDAQEEMYWNKTSTIQQLINANNERERERKKQKDKPTIEQ